MKTDYIPANAKERKAIRGLLATAIVFSLIAAVAAPIVMFYAYSASSTFAVTKHTAPKETMPMSTESYIPTETTEIPETTIETTVAPTEECIPPETTAPVILDDAHYVWLYLKECGYSDVVAAGIMGNIMTECGGCTFDLDTDIWDPSGIYYGICQWYHEYYPEIMDAPLDEQLSHLSETLPEEFDMFAGAFDYSYTEFVEEDDPREAARKFAQIYERCDPTTYEQRQDCAESAYSRFA